MKLQHFIPIEESDTGLKSIYHPVGDDSFFINYPYIHTENQILTTGNTYILIKSSKYIGVELLQVVLVDVILKNEAIYLIVEDLKTNKKYKLMLVLDNFEVKCQWILLNLTYLQRKITELYVKNYCCGNNK